MSDKRREEKERLWNEVMNKPRAYEKDKTAEDIILTTEAVKEKEEKSNDILKTAGSALDELNRILQKQKKDLEDMANEMRKPKPVDPSLMDVQTTVNDLNTYYPDAAVDLDALEKELHMDYGVAPREEKKEPVKDFDSAAVFDEIQAVLNQKIVGQADAMRQLVIAFRRPFVMGEKEGAPKNVILLAGPRGSGKHQAVIQISRSLYEKTIFLSGEVSTIDMSRYTSGAQEQIFLQDLYEAISSPGSVICFENFESGFPSFLRMVDSLATTGSVTLSKRYVLSKGMLVEAQTGLVKDAVDSLSAAGKYLIFITTGSASKVQDSFGADFMYHVMDTVTTKALDEASVKMLIDKETDALITKAQENLRIRMNVLPPVKQWVKDHYDKTGGADSISDLFYDFYVSLSHVVLNEGLGHGEEIEAVVKEDKPLVNVHDRDFVLSRSKNSEEEINEVNAALDEIVGLDMVKSYIRSLQSHIAIQQRRREQGMKTASLAMHMIFTGNPGTGKTTIARLISRYMKAIGALTKGQLVEVTRADLVAQYVGQTAPLTMSVIKSAIGGVIFIDEAYSLYRGKDDSFGLECIDTIVKAMEDNRDNLIVILAGYSKEMSVFMESNSGLKSRFPNLIHFPDYTGEELRKIAVIQAKSKGYKIAEDVLAPLEEYFTKVQSINAAEAGNGRLARNVVEDAILKQAGRIVKDPSAEMTELLLEDFDFTIKVQPPKQKEVNPFEELLKLQNNK